MGLEDTNGNKGHTRGILILRGVRNPTRWQHRSAPKVMNASLYHSCLTRGSFAIPRRVQQKGCRGSTQTLPNHYAWHPLRRRHTTELAVPTVGLCSADGDFIRGTKGAGTCPTGTNVISTPEECAWAAKSLGLIPAGSPSVSNSTSGLSYQEVKGSSSKSPHPGCSYLAARAAGISNKNRKIVNFNSNLNPFADLSFDVQLLCRCGAGW